MLKRLAYVSRFINQSLEKQFWWTSRGIFKIVFPFFTSVWITLSALQVRKNLFLLLNRSSTFSEFWLS